MEAVGVAVEELDRTEGEIRLVDLVAAAKGPIEDLARAEVPDLHLGERARAARGRRLHVHVEDDVRIAVEEEPEPALEVAGREHGQGLV